MHDILKIAGGFVGGLAVGFAAGYLITRKSAELAYASIAVDEIQKVKDHYRLLRKDGVTLDGDESSEQLSVEEYAELLKENGYPEMDLDALQEMFAGGIDASKLEAQYISESVIAKDDKTHHIFDAPEFDDDDDGPDFAEAVSNRDPLEPFIIHVNEFMDDEGGFEKITLTYYEGDDTLVGPQDSVVPDMERLIGHEALTNFGRFSGDKKIVYVRNQRMDIEADFEIHHHEGEYAEVVLGVSNRVPLMRMRDDD